jgi:hypothetical protein
MNSITGLTSQQLRRAADLKERIDALQNELEALLGGGAATPAAKPTGPRKHRMSAAGRAAIAAAAKARWAAYRTKAPAEAAAPAKKAKRKFSPEGRARLAALAKERWAKAKKAGKSKL